MEEEAVTGAATRAVLDAYLHSLLTGADFGQHFAPDVVWTTMESGAQVRGRDAVRDFIIGLHTRAFDAHPELVNSVAGEGTAMLEAVFIGTHTGEFAGIPATGAHVRLPYGMAYDITDGAITALRAYFPMAALRALLAGADHPAPLRHPSPAGDPAATDLGPG
jgi:predicted ester cyclase